MAKFRTHYDNLKVARNAPDAVIRAAYKALMQKYHPDKYDGDPKEAERIAKIIQASFNILSDPVKRAEHDEWIRQQERKEKEEQEFQEVNDGPRENPFNTGDTGYESWHYQSAPKNDSPKDSHANQPPPPDSPPSPSPANPLDARIPILRPAFSWAFWIFLFTLGTFRKPPSSPYGVNYFLTAMASATLLAIVLFCIVALVQGIRRALGHAPSKSKVPYISDWFTPFESVTDAEGVLKISFITILAYEAIIVALVWSANHLSMVVLEYLATAGLAWWCYRRPSLVPAFILVALSLMAVVATGINKFSGGEGGQNLFMAIFIALISVQVWRAVSYIKNNSEYSTDVEPAVATQDSNWLAWAVAVAIGVAIVIPFLDEQKKNAVAYEAVPQASANYSNAQLPTNQSVQPDNSCSYCPEMVRLPIGISMGKYEVTQGQWRAVMGNNPSYFSSCGDDCPVEQVSWNDAQEYIQRLNAKTGRRYRLSRENEWYEACQAGGFHEYCGSDSFDVVAWYGDNAGGLTHPAGQKHANAWGLYDLSGNVWEWTQDCYDGSCSRRVNRGGSWYSKPVGAADRDGDSPVGRGPHLGFRLAQD